MLGVMAHHLTTSKDVKLKYTVAAHLRATAPKNSANFFLKGLIKENWIFMQKKIPKCITSSKFSSQPKCSY